jgi:hypothetical protein
MTPTPFGNNKLATGRLGEIWRKVANETLEHTGDEGRAMREANDVIDRVRKRWSDSVKMRKTELSSLIFTGRDCRAGNYPNWNHDC